MNQEAHDYSVMQKNRRKGYGKSGTKQAIRGWRLNIKV